VIAGHRAALVRLDDAMLAWIAQHVEGHIAHNRGGTMERTYEHLVRNGLEPRAMGRCGEAALAQHLGIDYRAEANGFDPDRGVDLRYGGSTIEVKTTSRQQQSLLVPHYQWPLRADIAVLVWPVDPLRLWAIVGWATRADLGAHAVWRGDLPKACYQFPYTRLRPIAWLPNHTSSSPSF